MKYAFIFCMISSIWPGAAMADPLVDIAIHLADRPEADLEEFMDHVIGSFSEPVVFDQSFGPNDMPDGHDDPMYWAVTFRTSVDGHKLWAQCNRIGHESVLLLRTPGYRGMTSSKSFADLLDPQLTLQGSWPDPMPAFANDATARLDCSINTEQHVDGNAATSALGAVFSDVQVKDGLPNLFGSGSFLIEASRGDWNSIRRLDSATIASDDSLGPKILITSWLLAPIT